MGHQQAMHSIDPLILLLNILLSHIKRSTTVNHICSG